MLRGSERPDGHVEPSYRGRPPVSSLDPDLGSLIFLQTEVDHYDENEEEKAYSMKFPSAKDTLTIRMFGVTENGNSVLCHVKGFFPYFYVKAPEDFKEYHCEDFKNALNKAMSKPPRPGTIYIYRVSVIQAETIYGFNGNLKSSYLKIETHFPNYISSVKKTLEKGFSFDALPETVFYKLFESNLPFILRFMIDTKVTGMNWIHLPERTYTLRHVSNKTSTCQIEVDIHYTEFISYAPDGKWTKVPPLRVLSFDIECAGRKGIFPEPNLDPVIQIANMVTLYGESEPIVRNVFTLKDCGHIAGSEVLSYETEKELLESWGKFFIASDPDIIIGYNILNFDFPYLLDRASTLGLKKFNFLGRITSSPTKYTNTIFSSKAYGTRESKAINLDGRIIFDLYLIIQRDYKLRSYTLNSVSSHFLGEQKEEVHHSIITELQNGDKDTRRRLAVYCLKDAYLPQRLTDKLMLLINYIEMARVTGIPFNFLLFRGQQIKVVSQLYRKALEELLLIPENKVEASEEQYEGATVIEPNKGYYDVPILTLDFASLYPSIMMAFNLCYTTLLDPKDIPAFGLKRGDYIQTPSGEYFVKEHIRKGVLNVIFEDLLGARKRAKELYKMESDPFRKAVLDGRQAALKMSANSVYGFTGATVGKLPCIGISQSVTAIGRQMIQQAQTMVETKYTIENGYQANAKIIYGDTDSIMVNFGRIDLSSAMSLAREAATFVSDDLPKPIHLEFEKAYFPYLLINKKRYAGLYWTNPNNYDKIDSKGIETVRRDNCRLVQTLINNSLHKILIERDVEGAKKYVKQTISDLLQNKIDMSQLVITKQLTKSVESYTGKQAHVELAEKMRKRDPGSAPTLGDRVAYIIIKAQKGAAAYEKSEDPIYVLEHNLPIDTNYYLENQLSKPLMRIFEPILKNPQELLNGEHTRTVHLSVPTLGALRKFTVKTELCLNCRVSLVGTNNNKAVCDYCIKEIEKIYFQQMELNNALEVKFSRLWTQCQRCQGSIHQEVLCTNKDCPIFYMRKKVQKDMKDASNVIQRFDYSW